MALWPYGLMALWPYGLGPWVLGIGYWALGLGYWGVGVRTTHHLLLTTYFPSRFLPPLLLCARLFLHPFQPEPADDDEGDEDERGDGLHPTGKLLCSGIHALNRTRPVIFPR